jgi:hypothetical protein
MIEELLITTVGATVAKLTLAWWLREPSFVVEASSGLIDALAKRTSDLLAVRRGSREFEVLAEKSAERLKCLIDSEFPLMDKDKLVPVCHTVSDIFGKVRPSADLMAQNNLDPYALASYYRQRGSRFTKGLSDDENALVERLLVEVCSQTLEFASHLPVFTMRTLAEVLKREDAILSAIAGVSERLQQLQEEAYRSSSVTTRMFGVEYRRAVIRSFSWMELFGADLSSASRHHQLSVAYINLSVKQKGLASEGPPNVLRAPEAIQTARCIFLRGPAGAGKTTLLKWIAVNAAAQDFAGSLENWNYLVPFFVKLRQCVDLKPLPGPERFSRLVAPLIAAEQPEG